MSMKVTFLGAAGAVTGSKYLVELGARRVLIDCGLFQGLKRLRERNWQPLPFSPPSLDAVLLTHAHIDHSGYLPVLVRDGYRGPIYCTEATGRLLSLMLPDAARLQEEAAEYANRHKYSKHSPALPLYTEADARAALERLHPVALPSEIALFADVQASFSRAGHLLGAASIRLESRSERILFSGDLGRTHDPLMRSPTSPPAVDWVVIESTYGDRLHSPVDPESELVAPLARTLARGGVGRGVEGAQPKVGADDHPGGERHGKRRARRTSPEGVCAGCAQSDSLHRLPGRRYPRRRNARRGGEHQVLR